MEQKLNPVGWFEIPVSDMDRAIGFYENVFNIKLQRQQFGDTDMAWFPWVENGNGSAGSLVRNPEFYYPSVHGVVIYFTAMSGNLDNELSRVEKAGGRVLRGKTCIAENIGYMALILDTEGNRIALHSRC